MEAPAVRGYAAQRQAIIDAAREEGIDPAIALAIAERESNFNPRARNSKTIRGMFQMRGDHRRNYGIGDSDDPYEQTKGWASFYKDVKKEMGSALGRDPTDAEGYLGHHFGGVRAGRMMRMAPDTPVSHVFTPREMDENPHFSRAGTVGRLNSSILADMQKRSAKFGDVGTDGTAESAGWMDFSEWGDEVDPDPTYLAQPGKSAAPSNGTANLNMGSKPAASGAMDFSQFGDEA
jgi:hypothetical protein